MTLIEWHKKYGELTKEDIVIIGRVLSKTHPRAHETAYGEYWDLAVKDYFIHGRGHVPPYKHGEARAYVTCQVLALL